MSKFFVEPSNIENDIIIIDKKRDVQHITNVLRLGKGSEIDISDSSNFEYHCEIIYLDKGQVEAKILNKQTFTREASINVTLFQGVPKHGKMDLIVQKTVELGIREIVPTFMDRTIITDKAKFDKKVERANKIAGEASKQCKRGTVPNVSEAVTFEEALEMIKTFDICIFPYENEEGVTIKDELRRLDEKVKDIAVIIGPEGGFSHGEAEKLKAIGAKSVSLGKTILRTETASIVAVAMLMYELEL